MAVIVGFDVGRDRKGIKWLGWFSRWKNGGRSGRCQRWGSGGFFAGMSVCTCGAGGCWCLLCDCSI